MDDQAKIEAFVAEAERILGSRWAEIVGWLRNRQSLEAMERLIVAGRGASLISRADLAHAGRALAADVNGIYVEAAQRAAEDIGTAADSMVRYDVTDRRALASMRERVLRFVGGLTHEQEAVVRAALVDGTTRAVNPREIARAIRSSVGLTAPQAEAVASYRRALERAHEAPAAATSRELSSDRADASVERAGRTGRPLSPERIDTMVEQYRQNQVAYRAEVIARSNALPAVHEGAEDALHQAIDRGQIKAEQVVRVWHAARDARTRDSHRAMGGQQVAAGEAFTSGSGATLRYPGDPSAPAAETAMCRCSVSTRFVS